MLSQVCVQTQPEEAAVGQAVREGTAVVVRNLPWKGHVGTVVRSRRKVLLWGKRLYTVQLAPGQKDGGRYVHVTKVIPEAEYRIGKW